MRSQLVAGVADAGQVRHRRQRGLPRDPAGDARRSCRGCCRRRRRSRTRSWGGRAPARGSRPRAAARRPRPWAGRTRRRTSALPARGSRACCVRVPWPWRVILGSDGGAPCKSPRRGLGSRRERRVGPGRLPGPRAGGAGRLPRRAGRTAAAAGRGRGAAGRRGADLGGGREDVPRLVLLVGAPRRGAARRRRRGGRPGPGLRLARAAARQRAGARRLHGRLRQPSRPAEHAPDLRARAPRLGLARRPRAVRRRPRRSCSATCCSRGPTSCCAAAGCRPRAWSPPSTCSTCVAAR